MGEREEMKFVAFQTQGYIVQHMLSAAESAGNPYDSWEKSVPVTLAKLGSWLPGARYNVTIEEVRR